MTKWGIFVFGRNSRHLRLACPQETCVGQSNSQIEWLRRPNHDTDLRDNQPSTLGE